MRSETLANSRDESITLLVGCERRLHSIVLRRSGYLLHRTVRAAYFFILTWMPIDPMRKIGFGSQRTQAHEGKEIAFFRAGANDASKAAPGLDQPVRTRRGLSNLERALPHGSRPQEGSRCCVSHGVQRRASLDQGPRCLRARMGNERARRLISQFVY
jgi:hypothetical protein